jgi:hypothetical protein
MAKPINPYQGPAPAAMAQMGQGMAEVGANIGRTLQRGYEAMGQGIASGITAAGTAAGNAYKDYKKTESEVKASEKAYDTFKDFLDPEARKNIDEKIEGVNKDTSLSLQDKAAFWNQAKSFIGGSVNQSFAMQKQKAELDARANLQAAGDVAARDRAVLGGQTQLDVEQLRQKYRAQQGSGVNFGLDPFGGGGAGGGAGYYNQQYGE